MSFRSVSTMRSYEQVVEQLTERIHSGEFRPNQRLPTERELGELFWRTEVELRRNFARVSYLA